MNTLKGHIVDVPGPIFILASERSGTNLLRRRLSEWQKVAYGPPPLHLLKHLFYAQPFYGDFSNTENLERFLNDALGLAYNHFSPWQIDLSQNDLIDWHEQEWDGPVTAISVMHAMFTLYARHHGYETYICKDNNLFDYYNHIVNEIPSSRFVYLYRDPRDVVSSQLKRPTQGRSIAKLAMLWRDEQLKSIQAVGSLGLAGNHVVEICYEDLVTREFETIRRVCRQLLLGDIEAEQDNQVFDQEQSDIQEWDNLDKKTVKTSIARYKRQLRKFQIKLIEHIVWHQMNYLQYIPLHPERPPLNGIVIEMDKLIGKIHTFLGRVGRGKQLTDGQKKQQQYLQKIKKNIFI